MRFEAKKKALSAAANIVRQLTEALSVAAENTTKNVQIAAGEKGLKLRTQSGGQIVEASVTEVNIEQQGVAWVEMASLTQALSVSGDSISMALDNKTLRFNCGRAKGTMPVQTVAKEEDPPTPPATVVQVGNLKALLKSVTLKSPTGKNFDRTLHFYPKKNSVCSEATDAYRGVSAVASVAETSKAYNEASLSLPAKALDTVAGLLDGAGNVGFNERFFRVKTQTFSVCMPLSGSQPLTILAQGNDFVAQQTKHGVFRVKVADMVSALNDALSLASTKEGGRVEIEFGPKTGRFIGESDQGAIETTFDITTKTNEKATAAVVPSFLRECLGFYRPTDEVSFAVYSQSMVLDLASTEEGGLMQQTTLIPFLSPVGGAAAEQPAPAKSTKQAKQPDADEGEDEESPPPPPKKTQTQKAPTKKEPEAVTSGEGDSVPPPQNNKKLKAAAAKNPPPPKEDEEEAFDEE